jgi:hypothetical protein
MPATARAAASWRGGTAAGRREQAVQADHAGQPDLDLELFRLRLMLLLGQLRLLLVLVDAGVVVLVHGTDAGRLAGEDVARRSPQGLISALAADADVGYFGLDVLLARFGLRHRREGFLVPDPG